MTREIPLSRGKVAIVDDEDYEWLMQWRWSYDGRVAFRGGRKYEGRKNISMHRVITNAQPNQDVDHINGDPLDNRKANLRCCAHAENQRNRKKQAGTASTYKGVWWRKDVQRWAAGIMINQKQIHLGFFDSELDAARAYNSAALKYFGEFARLNDIP